MRTIRRQYEARCTDAPAIIEIADSPVAFEDNGDNEKQISPAPASPLPDVDAALPQVLPAAQVPAQEHPAVVEVTPATSHWQSLLEDAMKTHEDLEHLDDEDAAGANGDGACCLHDS